MQADAELNAVLNDIDRLKAVRASRLLDSPREKIFDDATLSICKALRVPMSLVTIIAPERQFFKSCIGLDDEMMEKREGPIKYSTCQYVVKKGGIVIIDDVKNDPFFCTHEGLNGVGAGSYLGVPLLLFNQTIGSVCAVDVKARMWNDLEIGFLKNKAHLLSQEVARRA